MYLYIATDVSEGLAALVFRVKDVQDCFLDILYPEDDNKFLWAFDYYIPVCTASYARRLES